MTEHRTVSNVSVALKGGQKTMVALLHERKVLSQGEPNAMLLLVVCRMDAER